MWIITFLVGVAIGVWQKDSIVKGFDTVKSWFTNDKPKA